MPPTVCTFDFCKNMNPLLIIVMIAFKDLINFDPVNEILKMRCQVYILTLLRMGGRPPTSFSPVTSTNVLLSPQNLLTFNFDPFATLV